MSGAQARRFRVRWRWCYPMIPWYRQVLSLVYGLGVMTIAVWAIDQGSSQWVILGTVIISMLTLMLIFGIEIDRISFGEYLEVDFTDTNGTGNTSGGDADE